MTNQWFSKDDGLFRRSAKQLGALLVFLALAMLVCAGLSNLAYFDPSWNQTNLDEGIDLLLGTAIGTFIFGAMSFIFGYRSQLKVGNRHALLVVSMVWVVPILFSAVPLYLASDLSLADALFEATSGLTTTGATALGPITEKFSAPLHLWRVTIHWIGGLGIIVLFVALFPTVGSDTRRIVFNEAAGPRTGNRQPRVRDTAKRIFGIYTILTTICFLAYCVAGMSSFDALAHAFSTLGTGGFSPLNQSIGEYKSIWIELTASVFMIVGAINFTLYPRAFKHGIRVFWDNIECRVFLIIVTFSIVLITANLSWDVFSSPIEALRYASFHVVATATTTGFGIADYEIWPGASQLILITLFFIGGCSGSTAGGMKVIRFMIILKVLVTEIRTGFRPALVQPVRVDGVPMGNKVLRTTLAYALVFLLTTLFGAIFVSIADPVDLTTALTASLACVANVGPAFGMVGPTDNYGFLSDASKMVLSLCMLLGRLEFFTMLALFVPSFWRR